MNSPWAHRPARTSQRRAACRASTKSWAAACPNSRSTSSRVPPGSGKTTLAHQIMFALAAPARPALYFTVLGEPPLKMLRYQQQFGFFDTGKIGSSVHLVNLGDDMAAGDLKKVLDRIVAEVQAHSPALVFVDSFRSVVLASHTSGQ